MMPHLCSNHINRNNIRRIRFLAGKLLDPVFQIAQHLASGFSTQTLHRMYDILANFAVYPVAEATALSIRNAISDEVCKRWNLRHAPTPVCRIMLTQFQHVLWDNVRLSSIFKPPHLHALLPHIHPQLKLGIPTFVYRCVKPLGRSFINNRALAMGRYGDFA
jgi:hypothetical protein